MNSTMSDRVGTMNFEPETDTRQKLKRIVIGAAGVGPERRHRIDSLAHRIEDRQGLVLGRPVEGRHTLERKLRRGEDRVVGMRDRAVRAGLAIHAHQRAALRRRIAG